MEQKSKRRRFRSSSFILFLQVAFVVIVCNHLVQLFIYEYKFSLRDVKSYKMDLVQLVSVTEEPPRIVDHTIKFILLWTPNVKPFTLMKEPGRSIFVKHNCVFFNCYITSNRSYFKDQTKFDAVLFSVHGIRKKFMPPILRAHHQKYVFVSTDPAPLYPALNPEYDGFFNWTWTYRLDSDILWRSFVIHDNYGRKVGPRLNMEWLNFTRPLDKDILQRMDKKTKAVMWIDTQCQPNSKEENYVHTLNEFREFTIDIYSECQNKNHIPCLNSSCHKLIKNYYFYLASESVFDNDLVTNNLLNAFQNYAVPIVFGGADYSRFLPPESYINANQMEPKEVVRNVQRLIYNFNEYMDYFKWTNYYTYKPSQESEICNICTALNDEVLVKSNSAYERFRVWWNGELKQKVFDGLLSIFYGDEELQSIAYRWGIYQKNYSIIFKYFSDKYLEGDEKIKEFILLMNANKNANNTTYGY